MAGPMAPVVISVQALRAFVYGFGAVILGTALAAEGLGDAAVGAIFTAMLAGMALTSSAIGRWGHGCENRVSPRRWLVRADRALSDPYSPTSTRSSRRRRESVG